MNLHQSFKIGARQMVGPYAEIHQQHGFDSVEWALLTSPKPWTPDQARAIRSLLANGIEASLSIAGMPAVPLPGQYCAAFIATVVAPANRITACYKCPDTFDAASASGIHETVEVKPMRVEQMIALVMAYSGGYAEEPPSETLDHEVVELVRKESKKA